MNKLFEKIKPPFRSLRTRFVAIFMLALCIAVMLYFLLNILCGTYIQNHYLKAENKAAREAAYHNNLQEYIKDEGITFETIDRVSEWARRNQYVYLLIYKEQTDDEAYYIPDDQVGVEPPDELPPAVDPDDQETSSDDEENADDSPIGGITIDWPTRSELEEEAKKRDMLVIELPENQYVYAKFAEYTEYLYYDIANLVSVGIAAATILVIMFLYITRLTKRISAIGADINVVAAGNTERCISVVGNDELSTLAGNVELMRSSIIDNYKRKKEALDANTALITSMSHDIRTPLTVLLGYIDVMRSRAAEDERMLEYISAAEKTAMRLKKLSDDMFSYFLVFAREDKAVELEEFEAPTIIEQLVSEHTLLMREGGYNIEMIVDSDALDGRIVMLDIASTLRIIDNIFSNLSKYADKAHPIVIEVGVNAERVFISAKNRISADKDKAESNGIGLKTCQKLAEIMSAEFEHKEENDSFYVKLCLQTK